MTPRFPRFRYSLRVLLAVFVMLGCAFAWIGNRIRHNGAQRRAIEQIWRMGGHVCFYGEHIAVRPFTKAQWSAALGKTWVDDAFVNRRPTGIIFAEVDVEDYPNNVTDDNVDQLIATIRQLPTVSWVRLDATKISKTGMERMEAELPGVQIENPHIRPP